MQEHRQTGDAGWRGRSEVEVIARQVLGIEAFHAARKVEEQRVAAEATSRELRLDADRQLTALDRAREVLIARTHAQLLVAGNDVFHDAVVRRVVVAHRNDWFARKVEQALREGDIQVVAQVDNGADALGVAVAEQPDFVLVEESLSLIPGVQVVRAIRRFSPWTHIAAQVADNERVAAMLDAGAATVFTRQVPPAEVAATIVGLARG